MINSINNDNLQYGEIIIESDGAYTIFYLKYDYGVQLNKFKSVILGTYQYWDYEITLKNIITGINYSFNRFNGFNNRDVYLIELWSKTDIDDTTKIYTDSNFLCEKKCLNYNDYLK